MSTLKRSCLFIAICWIASLPLRAQWQSIGAAERVEREPSGMFFRGAQASVRVTALAPDLIRVTLVREGGTADKPSWAVAKTEWPPAPVEMSGDGGVRVIRTSEIEVRARLAPFRLAFHDRSGRLISKDDDGLGMAWNRSRVRCWKALGKGERFFGLGEKIGPLNKRGRAHVLWNSDIYGYDYRLADALYISIPFFMGLQEGKAYGIFFNNTYRSSFDLGAESPEYYSFGAEGGDLDYYFFYGPDPKKVLLRYTELTGRTPLPPRWSLGYQQTRFGYYPEAYVRFIADNFRRRKIPCDALVLDIEYMNGFRVFTWDKKGFPDPKKMIADLRAQGFRMMLYQDPGVKVEKGYQIYEQGVKGGHFLKKPDNTLFVGKVWAGDSVFPDFTSPAVREWWGRLHEPLLELGAAGFENDMNEPAVFDHEGNTVDNDVVTDDDGRRAPFAKNHNVYGMLMTRAAREAMLRFRPNERPFQTTRSSFAGGQRYSAVFTGDNTSTWDGLRMSLQVLLSMGLSGYAHAGGEIGGFMLSPSPELYARWIEAGIFYPYCRTSTTGDTRNQEPWSFGNRIEDLSRRAIELRYRLLPYLYNTFVECSTTGLPILRALMLDFPDDSRALDQEYEFLFGNDILVAPVVKDDEATWPVYLPRGTWYDFWNDRPYRGPGTFTVEAPLGRIPMFVREGAIIPTQQVVQYTDEAPIDPLTFEIYPGANSVREYYEDDGISFDYQRGAFLRREIRQSRQEGGIEIAISAKSGSYQPPARSLILKVHGVRDEPRSVEINGSSLPRRQPRGDFERSASGWSFSDSDGVLSIKTPDGAGAMKIGVLGAK